MIEVVFWVLLVPVSLLLLLMKKGLFIEQIIRGLYICNQVDLVIGLLRNDSSDLKRNLSCGFVIMFLRSRSSST